MLVHINQPESAAAIENAWLKTLEDGMHTADIYSSEHSKKKLNTDEFAEAVIQRLGQKPTHFKPVSYRGDVRAKIECYGERKYAVAKKELVGVDLTLDNPKLTIEELAEKLSHLKTTLNLVVIASRGLKIWPNSRIDTPYTQHCTCRFQSAEDTKQLLPISQEVIIELMQEFTHLGLDLVKSENLFTFDDKLGFSLMQGQ
jgi:isocitrate dehydrogenase